MQDFLYIVLEMVIGKSGQSRKSDIYSFVKVVKFIFRKVKLGFVLEVIIQILEIDLNLCLNLQEVLNIIF